MGSVPRDIPNSNSNPVVVKLSDIERAMKNLTNKSLRSISVTNDNGTTLFSITNSGFVDVSGNPIVSLTLNDPISGTPIISQSPATQVINPDGTITGTNWFWRMDDQAGFRLIATDGLTGVGLALPFIPVPMAMKWNGGPFQTATQVGSASMLASSIVANTPLWEGRIGYTSHPVISVDGLWGDIDNVLITPVYQFVVGSQTFTWNAAGGQLFGLHKFDISSQIGQTDLQVRLSVTNTGGATGTDRIACQVLGTHLRQSPPDGVFG
jgi:hypothetical protein